MPELDAYQFEEHRQKHVELHHSLDILVADWIDQTKSMPSNSTIMELMKWSHEQTHSPTVRDE